MLDRNVNFVVEPLFLEFSIYSEKRIVLSTEDLDFRIDKPFSRGEKGNHIVQKDFLSDLGKKMIHSANDFWFGFRRVHCFGAIPKPRNRLELDHWKDFVSLFPMAATLTLYDAEELFKSIDRDKFFRNLYSDIELPETAFVLKKTKKF